MDKEHPECFGDIETVFPKGKDGLRHSPKTCLACVLKTQCLRTAMKGLKGLEVKREMLDKAYTSGTMSFLERWSQKKMLHRRLKTNTKNGQKGSGS